MDKIVSEISLEICSGVFVTRVSCSYVGFACIARAEVLFYDAAYYILIVICQSQSCPQRYGVGHQFVFGAFLGKPFQRNGKQAFVLSCLLNPVAIVDNGSVAIEFLMMQVYSFLIECNKYVYSPRE